MPQIIRLDRMLYSLFRDGVADNEECQVYVPDVFKLNELEFTPDKYAKMRVKDLMQDDNLVKVKDLRDFFKAYLMEDEIFFAAVNADQEVERTIYTLHFALSRKLLTLASDLNQSLVEQEKRLDRLEQKISDLEWSVASGGRNNA